MDLLQMSIQAGLLIAAVAVLRAAAMNRLPKTTFLFLWGVVLLRMLVPFSFSSAWSVYACLLGNTRTDILSLAGFSDTLGEVALPRGFVFLCSRLCLIWLSGALLLAALLGLLLFFSYRRLRFCIQITDNRYIAEWAAAHPLRRPLRITQTDRVAVPLSVGILRPRIILPKGMDLGDLKLVSDVLMHEYCHIRRFDMVWKLLALCAVCLHWFNPMAWLMLALLNRDLEITCDETVCRRLGGDTRAQKSYALSLLRMAELRSGCIPIFSYFSKTALDARINAIIRSKRATAGGIVIAALLVVLLTAAFTMSPTRADVVRWNTAKPIPTSAPPGVLPTARPQEFPPVGAETVQPGSNEGIRPTSAPEDFRAD